MSSKPGYSEEKDVDVDVDIQDVPVISHLGEDVETEIDQNYLNASKFTRFFRGTLFQMFMFGAMAFVGPAMSDAIGNLGGGGLSSPYLANLATSISYASSCAMALMGGPLINKIGIKYSCCISAACYVLSGTGYYVQARFGLQAYLLTARVVGGFTNAFLYVAESTAMLSYPFVNERGKYLGIWTAMRNSGAVIGGAINFGNNSSNSAAGGIAWSTYLIFIGFEASGIIFAVLLSQTRDVRRTDGSRVPSSGKITWAQEFKALWMHLRSPRVWLMFLPAFYSFFYGGTYNTYLSLHFSVRARALSSFLQPLLTIFTVLAYGLLLDNKRWSLKTRGWIGFVLWLVPQAACFIWTGILYGQWGTSSTNYAYDYVTDGADWARVYLPYLIVFTTGYWTQLNLYWILGTFSTDVKSSSRTGGLFRAFETAGSAVTYAINSAAGDKRIPLYVNCALLVATIPCMVGLIRLIPDEPSDIDDVAGDAVLTAAQKSDIAT